MKEDDLRSKPWFDSECKVLKNEIRSLGNRIRKAPLDKTLRLSLRDCKKNFRRCIMIKKRAHKGKMMSLLETKRNSGTQKEFWNIFRKISPRTRKDVIQPSLKKIFDHFQNLSNSSRAQDFPSESTGALKLALRNWKNAAKNCVLVKLMVMMIAVMKW